MASSVNLHSNCIESMLLRFAFSVGTITATFTAKFYNYSLSNFTDQAEEKFALTVYNSSDGILEVRYHYSRIFDGRLWRSMGRPEAATVVSKSQCSCEAMQILGAWFL